MQCLETARVCTSKPCSAFAGWHHAERSLLSNSSHHSCGVPRETALHQTTHRLGTSRRQYRQRGGLLILAAIKRKSDKHFICAKQVVAPSGTEEEVQQLCKEVLDFSLVRTHGAQLHTEEPRIHRGIRIRGISRLACVLRGEGREW